MSTHLARARLLLAQSRPADAERETLLALAAKPSDPDALALLAQSRVELGKFAEALIAAQELVGLMPHVAYAHYVHALVLHRMDRVSDAFAAAQEAVRIDPSDPDVFTLLAAIELSRRNWPGALEAAEQALALFPEHVGAANLRAMALVRLGRKEEATATVDYALHRAPENGFSHANQGWNCLHRNDPLKAQEHFREALRLDPELEYAREGMLEALKARNPLYRGMLAYFLWMSRLGARYQWAIVIGSYLAGKVLIGLARSMPEYKWTWWVILGGFYFFVYLTWTAQPMFNLLLRFDRFGRHVLSPDQRTASNWFGAFFVSALAALGWAIADQSETSLFALIVLAMLSICVAATFLQRQRGRVILAVTTGVLASLAAVSFIPVGTESAPNALILFFIYGFIGFQFLANAVATKRA